MSPDSPARNGCSTRRRRDARFRKCATDKAPSAASGSQTTPSRLQAPQNIFPRRRRPHGPEYFPRNSHIPHQTSGIRAPAATANAEMQKRSDRYPTASDRRHNANSEYARTPKCQPRQTFWRNGMPAARIPNPPQYNSCGSAELHGARKSPPRTAVSCHVHLPRRSRAPNSRRTVFPPLPDVLFPHTPDNDQAGGPHLRRCGQSGSRHAIQGSRPAWSGTIQTFPDSTDSPATH